MEAFRMNTCTSDLVTMVGVGVLCFEPGGAPQYHTAELLGLERPQTVHWCRLAFHTAVPSFGRQLCHSFRVSRASQIAMLVSGPIVLLAWQYPWKLERYLYRVKQNISPGQRRASILQTSVHHALFLKVLHALHVVKLEAASHAVWPATVP